MSKNLVSNLQISKNTRNHLNPTSKSIQIKDHSLSNSYVIDYIEIIYMDLNVAFNKSLVPLEPLFGIDESSS